jgi:hypothetical protein
MPKGRNNPRNWLPSERFALTNWSRAPHLGQSEGVGLVALDPSAFDRIGRPARVHAYH